MELDTHDRPALDRRAFLAAAGAAAAVAVCDLPTVAAVAAEEGLLPTHLLPLVSPATYLDIMSYDRLVVLWHGSGADASRWALATQMGWVRITFPDESVLKLPPPARDIFNRMYARQCCRAAQQELSPGALDRLNAHYGPV